MIFAAQTAKITPSYDFPVKAFRRLGSEDPFKHIGVRADYKTSIDFGIANSAFIKYGINAINAGGTIHRSLSMGYSIPIDGTTHYIKMRGTRMEALRLSANAESELWTASADLVSSVIDDPSSSDYIGSGAHATADSTQPWAITEGGAGPITWGGSNLNFLDINATFTRNLSNKRTIGDANIKFQRATIRQVVADFTVEWLEGTLEDDLRAGTKRDLSWTLDTGVSVITFSTCRLINLSGRDVDAESTDTMPMKIGLEAESVNVT